MEKQTVLSRFENNHFDTKGGGAKEWRRMDSTITRSFDA